MYADKQCSTWPIPTWLWLKENNIYMGRCGMKFNVGKTEFFVNNIYIDSSGLKLNADKTEFFVAQTILDKFCRVLINIRKERK